MSVTDHRYIMDENCADMSDQDENSEELLKAQELLLSLKSNLTNALDEGQSLHSSQSLTNALGDGQSLNTSQNSTIKNSTVADLPSATAIASPAPMPNENADRKDVENENLDEGQPLNYYKEELEKCQKKLSRVERQLEKSEKYNEELRLELEKLNSELHEYRSAKKHRADAATQTGEEAPSIEKESGKLHGYRSAKSTELMPLLNLGKRRSQHRTSHSGKIHEYLSVRKQRADAAAQTGEEAPSTENKSVKLH